MTSGILSIKLNILGGVDEANRSSFHRSNYATIYFLLNKEVSQRVFSSDNVFSLEHIIEDVQAVTHSIGHMLVSQ